MGILVDSEALNSHFGCKSCKSIDCRTRPTNGIKAAINQANEVITALTAKNRVTSKINGMSSTIEALQTDLSSDMERAVSSVAVMIFIFRLFCFD